MSRERDIARQHAAIGRDLQDPALIEAADTVIAACDGDAHAAIRTLIVALDFAEERVEQLTKAVSLGYARHLFDRRPEYAAAATDRSPADR